MGRLEWGPAVDAVDVSPRELILAAGLDVVVTRYPSSQFGVSESLSLAPLRSVHADTLLYFGMPTPSAPPPSGSEIRLLEPGDAALAADLAQVIFAGYPNHHSANSIFSALSVPDAYADWSVRSLSTPDMCVFTTLTEERHPPGLCVLDLTQARTAEIGLAGIHPAERRHGHYLRLLAAASGISRAAGKDEIVISTQSSNIPALRAWCRVGMQPLMSLTTLHVMTDALRPEHRQ